MLPSDRHDMGFSLVELMVVVLIIGILVSIAVAVHGSSVERAGRIACLSNQRTLSGSIDTYRAENDSQNPQTILDLAPYVTSESSLNCATDPAVQLIMLPASQAVTCPLHP